jgi:hypothetical protein
MRFIELRITETIKAGRPALLKLTQTPSSNSVHLRRQRCFPAPTRSSAPPEFAALPNDAIDAVDGSSTGT